MAVVKLKIKLLVQKYALISDLINTSQSIQVHRRRAVGLQATTFMLYMIKLSLSV